MWVELEANYLLQAELMSEIKFEPELEGGKLTIRVKGEINRRAFSGQTAHAAYANICTALAKARQLALLPRKEPPENELTTVGMCDFCGQEVPRLFRKGIVTPVGPGIRALCGKCYGEAEDSTNGI